MNSTNEGRNDTSMGQTESTARRRVEIRATSKAAIAGGAGRVVLVLLFLATAGYFVFGATHEGASTLESKTSIAAFGAGPAEAGDAQVNAKNSSAYAAGSDYFPSAFPNRGRDGEGNVMTYEHD